MTEAGTGLPERRRGLKSWLLIAAIAIVLGIIGLMAYGRAKPQAVAPVAAASPAPPPPIDVAPSHMTRAEPYSMVTVYFEPHQIDDDSNQDALIAIKLAAEEVNKTGQSLVVTCHGEDAIPGSTKATEKDLKQARFVTIRDDLIAQGVEARRIKYEWNDPTLAAAAEKEGPESTADRPNCYIETAVPTSLE